jgi:hypothetical protein
MTSCEERYTEKIRDETRAVDQKAIVTPGCNGSLTSTFFRQPSGIEISSKDDTFAAGPESGVSPCESEVL